MNSKIDKIMQERQLASQAMERILELCVWLSERDAYDLLTLIQAEIQQVKSYYQPEIKTHHLMKEKNAHLIGVNYWNM